MAPPISDLIKKFNSKYYHTLQLTHLSTSRAEKILINLKKTQMKNINKKLNPTNNCHEKQILKKRKI